MKCYRRLDCAAIEKCTLACPVLDRYFDGGLPCRSITELTGEASVGKSQVCLQLLLTCQLPRQHGGLDGSAIYMYTEGEPSLERLRQLSKLLPYRVHPAALERVPDPMDNIFIETGFDSGTDLVQRLMRLRPLLERSSPVSPRRVRALVIDSIAHLFRDVGDNGGIDQLAGRMEVLFKISSLLRQYADEFNLVVLITNQVMDSVRSSAGSCGASGGSAAYPNASGHTGGLALISNGREVIPALGIAWANCINARIFLSKAATPGGERNLVYSGPPSAATQAAVAGGMAQLPRFALQLRHMQFVFSPMLPQRRCAYLVEVTGIRGLLPCEDAAAEPLR